MLPWLDTVQKWQKEGKEAEVEIHWRKVNKKGHEAGMENLEMYSNAPGQSLCHERVLYQSECVINNSV